MRHALLGRMLAAGEPVISVAAPPGYGKTTFLTQWAARRGRPLAWISCDRIHDDPVFLWTAILEALSAIEPLEKVPARVHDDAERLGEHLVEVLGGFTRPITLVFDQLETLSNPDTRDLIAASAMGLPARSTLALASQRQLPFSMARMRVHRRVLEVGPSDLAMTRLEGSFLLRGAGATVTNKTAALLVRQTGGWPGALYLAALGIRTGEVSPETGISGDHPLLRDYLRSELLDHLSRKEAELLMRTSILDTFDAALAQAVAGDGHRIEDLEELHSRNLLVERADTREGWYRCHPLFRQMLQGELRRSESPGLPAELHARASTWFESTGDLEAAIEHAHDAGDSEQFGRLVLEAMQPAWASGRVQVVEAWMERLGQRSPQPHTPAMIAHGALIFALLGRTGDAERWAAVAESLPAEGTLPDGSTVGAIMAYLRANLCRQGTAVMREDCLAALAGLSPTSPYRATMLHTLGLAALVEGDLDQADAEFAHAYDLAISLETSPLAALVLSEQFLVQVERDQWTAAYALIKRTLELVSRGPFDSYWTSALVYAAAAHAAAHRGDMREAQEHLTKAVALQPLLTYALPVVSVQALLELARAHLALVDPANAQAALDQVHGILRQRPGLGTLETATAELQERVQHVTKVPPFGTTALTPAELRLLPLIPTHMTMAQMGERLFITRNTVKTHLVSLYRKLGVSSRREAVDKLAELGLL